jgi:UDP-N-acetylmuramate dehydrogenase
MNELKCLEKLGIAYKRNEPMSAHTSLHIGGPADIMLQPETEAQARFALAACRDNGIPALIIGNGTNLLVKDGGIRGAVIQLGERFSVVKFDAERVYALAGARLMTVSSDAAERSLGGLEFACGIPGSIGGAVAMNAGAYGGELKDVLTHVTVIDPSYDISRITVCDGDLGYRTSRFAFPAYTVLSAELKLTPNDDGAKARCDAFLKSRREKQPLTYPSAGSTFKRPMGGFAAKLIEDAGLKGLTVGGAQVSQLHSGFIINLGGASAHDVLELIAQVQKRVFDHSGIMLEPEVRIVGEGG